jgi:hypothetical protein
MPNSTKFIEERPSIPRVLDIFLLVLDIFLYRNPVTEFSHEKPSHVHFFPSASSPLLTPTPHDACSRLFFFWIYEHFWM